MAIHKCKLCDLRVVTGTRKSRIRWLENPYCRDCDNYILENFNYNGNHLSVYIDSSEYVKGINTSMSII